MRFQAPDTADQRQMKAGPSGPLTRWLSGFLKITAVLLAATASAFPPAPHHTLFGLVRNQWGDPIDVTDAKVFILTVSGASVEAFVAVATQPGVNYEMRVPMDAGITADLYQSAALRQNQTFQLKVRIGATVYLPIEMTLTSAQLGRPAESTRLDLTLGVDTDGDGLPDAWEQAIIARLGGTLAGITPGGDIDGDGISNLHEYLAGTFAFDPNDGFSLALAGRNNGNTAIEFLAVRGRTYSIQASSDLRQWNPVSFRLTPDEPQAPLLNTYQATDVRLLRIEVADQPGGQTNRYFKAVLR